MLLVNPNRGFGWHQDNQNGPIDFPDAALVGRDGQVRPGRLRRPGVPHGLPPKPVGDSDAVFVNLEDGDLGKYGRKTKFVPEPGDLIIWNSRTIHRILAPPDQCWGDGMQRRAIGGTVAKGGTSYRNKGGASGISDLAGHSQVNGEPLQSPYFPRIYPTRDPEEELVRAEGRLIGRSPKKIAELAVTLAGNAGKYMSFTKVVGKKGS